MHREALGCSLVRRGADRRGAARRAARGGAQRAFARRPTRPAAMTTSGCKLARRGEDTAARARRRRRRRAGDGVRAVHLRRAELPVLRDPARPRQTARADRRLRDRRATTDHATPLPRWSLRAHDSAAIAIETTVRVPRRHVRGTRRLAAALARQRRPQAGGVAVHFAPGASSATLRGNASPGWYDDYSFAANAGQKLLIDDVSSRAKTTPRRCTGPMQHGVAALRAGVAALRCRARERISV